jgi:hypothetical protein
MSNNFDGPVLLDSLDTNTLTNILGFGRNQPFGLVATGPVVGALNVDPSAGAGVAANLGSLALRYTGGSVQAWQKTSAPDTGWTLLGGGSPSSAVNYMFVWQPGGTAGANVYTDWTSLYAAAGAVSGLKMIVLDPTFSGDFEITGLGNQLSQFQFFGIGNLIHTEGSTTLSPPHTMWGQISWVTTVALAPVLVFGNDFFVTNMSSGVDLTVGAGVSPVEMTDTVWTIYLDNACAIIGGGGEGGLPPLITTVGFGALRVKAGDICRVTNLLMDGVAGTVDLFSTADSETGGTPAVGGGVTLSVTYGKTNILTSNGAIPSPVGSDTKYIGQFISSLAGGAPIAQNLPPVNLNVGQRWVFTKIGPVSTPDVITPDGADTIQGLSSLSLLQPDDVVELVAAQTTRGDEWLVNVNNVAKVRSLPLVSNSFGLAVETCPQDATTQRFFAYVAQSQLKPGSIITVTTFFSCTASPGASTLTARYRLGPTASTAPGAAQLISGSAGIPLVAGEVIYQKLKILVRDVSAASNVLVWAERASGSGSLPLEITEPQAGVLDFSNAVTQLAVTLQLSAADGNALFIQSMTVEVE